MDPTLSGSSGAVSGALPSAGARPRTSAWQKWAAVGVAAIAVLALLTYALTRPVAPPRVLRTESRTPIDPKSGIVTDGARLYFIESQSILSQTSVTGGETFTIPTSLENTGFANVFDISPDEFRPRRIPRMEPPSTVRCGACRFWAVRRDAWDHWKAMPGRGRRTAKRWSTAKGTKSAWRAATVSDPHPLLTTAGTPSDIRWSPDASLLRFTLNDPLTNSRTIWQASASGGNLHELLPGWNSVPNECCGNWTPDGRYYVFQSLQDDTANIWALRERGGLFSSKTHEPVQLTTGPMNVGSPVASRDGKKLFVQGWKPRGELVRYDSKSGQLAPYLSGLSAMGLDFSRDGQWVAYNDSSDGTMWRSKLDGSQKLQLVFPPMLAYLPRWSPDGKQIAFFGHPPGAPYQIYVVPAEGGTPELIYRNDMNLADPSWSPDGKSMAFGENSPEQSRLRRLHARFEYAKSHRSRRAQMVSIRRVGRPTGADIAAITLDS